MLGKQRLCSFMEAKILIRDNLFNFMIPHYRNLCLHHIPLLPFNAFHKCTWVISSGML